MARPRVLHDGFLIPNAGDVANPKMAEPDRIDFNTVGNDRWGVIEGCLITVSGSTASTLGGTAIVNGVLVTVKNGTALLGVGAAQDRFDLVVTDVNGTLKVVPGTPSTDPVFPDPPDDVTILAAVFCPAGTASLVDNVIDKRNWLADALLTRLDPTKPLIQNRNGVGDEYLVGGDGHTTWANDTELLRVAEETLQIIRHLLVEGNLSVGEGISARSITADEEITGSNLRNGDTLPATGNNGDLFQLDTTGRLYMWTKGHWEEMATISGAVPVGSIIQSMQTPDYMTPLGWVAMRGQNIQREQYPSLFDIPSLAQFMTGPDTMTMPDATGRVMISDFNRGAGKIGGAAEVVLSKNNLPAHDHGIAMGMGGIHDHAVTVARAGLHSHASGGGTHVHEVADPGHTHHGVDWFGQPSPIITAVWGGRNKLDALFNDKSHTYNVEPWGWLTRAFSGIQVSAGASGHGHLIVNDGDHGHQVTVGPHNGHTHPLTVEPVGAGAPVPVVQPYLTVYTYVRS